MPYQLYTTEAVYLDSNINAMCNAIINDLINQFTAPTLNAAFGLTGSSAKIIQGNANMPVQVIAFITNNTSIYNYLRSNIQNLISVTGVVDFSDRFQIITSRTYIEVWKKEGVLNLVNSNGIYSEDKNEIANYIL